MTGGEAGLPPGPARDLVDLLARLRAASRLSLGQIEARTELSRGYLSQVLNGKRTPRPATAETIARALGADDNMIHRARQHAERQAELNRYNTRKAREDQQRSRTGHDIAASVIDCSALIAERTEDFVGRRGIIERLRGSIHDGSLPSGYLVIGGEPGIGKTALLASIVRQWDLVHHFNSVLTGIVSEERFLRNMCAQLIMKYALPPGRFTAEAFTDSALLLDLLGQASARERVVIAIDAIDEAIVAPGPGNRLFLPPALPRGVFVVVTTRDPENSGLYVDERRDVLLDENDPENIADLTTYAGEFIVRYRDAMQARLRAAGMSQAEFTATLVERSEGNFMYAHHVLRAVRDNTLAGLGTGALASLPRGLQAYYALLEQQLTARGEMKPERQLAILAVLAAWPHPLTDVKIARFAGEKLSMTRAVLRRWAAFLNQFPANGRKTYSLYHASFRDFLASRLDMTSVLYRIEAAIEEGLL